MIRMVRLGFLMALAGSAAACEYGFGDGCVMGPCGGGGDRTPVDYVIGFPREKVDVSATTSDGGFVGRVRVGDSFSLVVVKGPPGGPVPSLADTVRSVAWAVSAPAVATLAGDGSGRGTFTATAPGSVRIIANGELARLWACEPNSCARVSEIEVAP